MSYPFRALAIGAVVVAAALACRASWAQATRSTGGAAAEQWALALSGLPAGPLAIRQSEPPTDSTADPLAISFADTPAGANADPPGDWAEHRTFNRLLGDVESYYTAPLHWDGEQWAYFGGVLGAVALAHHYDSNVRAHFVQGSGLGGSSTSTALEDALPAAALWFGTYLYSTEWKDSSGLTVSYAMLEAAGLSTVTDYALKYAVRREGPDATTSPNQWFASGSSFPSEHAAAAWAIGTVFAESGTGGFRWVTRVLGYGVASFTAYERLKHNAHWLSDVVGGAALGASTGFFVLDRTYGGASSPSAFSVVPVDGGLMLAYHKSLP
jgi:hypothetical protein